MNKKVKEIKDKPIIMDNIIGKKEEDILSKICLDSPLWKISPFTSDINEIGRFNESDQKLIKEAPQMVANIYNVADQNLGSENLPFNPYIYLPFYIALLKCGIVIPQDWMIRVKMNIQFQQDSSFRGKWNIPHVDYSEYGENHLTAIYYPLDSDGDTVLFSNSYEKHYSNEREKLIPMFNCSPKKGRILLFWGKGLHAGTHPVENDMRMCINYNFQLPEDFVSKIEFKWKDYQK